MAVITAKYPAGDRVAFGGISGTYAAVVAVTGYSCRIIVLNNATDKAVIWSLNGGTTDWYQQAAGKELLINLGAAELHSNPTISVKQGGDGAPTSGYVTAAVIAGG